MNRADTAHASRKARGNTRANASYYLPNVYHICQGVLPCLYYVSCCVCVLQCVLPRDT